MSDSSVNSIDIGSTFQGNISVISRKAYGAALKGQGRSVKGNFSALCNHSSVCRIHDDLPTKSDIAAVIRIGSDSALIRNGQSPSSLSRNISLPAIGIEIGNWQSHTIRARRRKMHIVTGFQIDRALRMDDRRRNADIQGHVVTCRDISRTALISINQTNSLAALGTDGNIISGPYRGRRPALKVKHLYRLGILHRVDSPIRIGNILQDNIMSGLDSCLTSRF